MSTRFRRYLIVVLGAFALWWGAVAVTLFMQAVNDRVVTLGDWKGWKASENQVRALLEELREEPATLVFGTSRANQLNEPILGRPTANLHYIYGNPERILALLQGLEEAQWANVEQLFLVVDWHTLEEGSYPTEIEPIFSPLDGPGWAWESLGWMNGQTMATALAFLWANLTGDHDYYVDESGAAVYLEPDDWDGTIPAHVQPEDPARRRFTAIGALTAIETLAREKGVEAVFTTPVLSLPYARLLDPILESYAAALAGALESYHLFLFVEGISDDPALFKDPSHLNVAGLEAWLALDWEDYRVTGESYEARVEEMRAFIEAAGD